MSEHPITIQSRKSEVDNAFYAFFFIDLRSSSSFINSRDDDIISPSSSSSENRIRVVKRIPPNKPEYDDIEDSLPVFLKDTLDPHDYNLPNEHFGNFVLTTSSHLRFFVIWRGLGTRVFVAISRFQLTNVARKVFELLEYEAKENLYQILLKLTEVPIIPACGISYELNLTNGVASIDFSSLDQIIDVDIDLVVMSVFTANMLICAWESVILERKVLIISSSAAVAAAACEFVKCTALPFKIVSTYIPYLPEDLICGIDLSVLEAPFPYLIGAVSSAVYSNQGLDLSDIVVLDLDNRSYRIPKQYNNNNTYIDDAKNPIRYNEFATPKPLLASLMKDISEIMLTPLSEWIQRPCLRKGEESTYFKNFSRTRSIQAESILQLFVQTNISLICAQYCSVTGFFRRPKDFSVSGTSRESMSRSTGRVGFQLFGNSANGCLQYFQESIDDNKNTFTFMPCWIEVDASVFAVYQYADDFPLLFIYLKDLKTVSPSPVEPQHHVFELVTRDGVRESTYRFLACDPDARAKWIKFIEDIMTSNKKLTNGTTIAPQFSSPSSELKDSNDDEIENEYDFKKSMTFRFSVMHSQMTTNLHAELDSSVVENIHFDKLIKVDDIIANISYGRIQNHTAFQTTILNFLEDLSTYDGTEDAIDYGILQSTNSIGTDDNDDDNNNNDDDDNNKVNRISLSEEKPKKSIFNFFTNKRSSRADLAAVKIEIPDDSEENKETETHISKLLSIAAIYRKCDTEIKKAVVDYRMHTTHDLLQAYKVESMNSSSSSSKIWKKQSDASTNVIVYDLITNSSTKERSPDDPADNYDGWYSSMWDTIVSLNENTLFDSDGSAPVSLSSLSSAAYMGNIRSELIGQLKILCENRNDAICKIIHACIGHIYFRNDAYETAVEEFALSDMFIDQPTVTFCLFRKLHELSQGSFGRKLFEDNKFDSNYFLKWAYSLNPIIGLQACRLLIALFHYDVEKSITNKMQLTAYSSKSRSRLSMKLDSAQIVSKENFGIVRKRSTISVVETQYTWVDQTLKKKGSSSSKKDLMFLNNVVVCTGSTSSPCQLSIDLLTRLLEFLSVIYNDPKSQNIKSNDKEIRILKVEANVLYNELVNSSAFQEFERQSCQLQIVDLSFMENNELYVFFINVYNTLCIHACLKEITNSGKALSRDLHGFHFTTECKYNIGGLYYSLVDIEHGMLRSILSPSSLLDGALPLNYFMNTRFKVTDPRNKFIPEPPGKPNITFVLNSLTKLSPAFTVLTSPENVDMQLKECARDFINRSITLNEASQIIYLPEQFKTFWNDFGRKRKYVIKFITDQLSGGTPSDDKLAAALTSMFHDSKKPLVDWIFPDDKKPVFLF